jgi:hypothetical protein
MMVIIWLLYHHTVDRCKILQQLETIGIPMKHWTGIIMGLYGEFAHLPTGAGVRTHPQCNGDTGYDEERNGIRSGGLNS